VLIRETGATAPGIRIVPTDAALARLDFLMAAIGSARVPTAAGTKAYIFPGAAATPADDGSGEGRARLAEAVGEIMAHFGRRPAAEMPPLLHGIAIRALARARGAAGGRSARLGAGLDGADVEPIERRIAYARHFAVEEHVLRHRRFDGAMSPPLERSVFTSGDAVTVLPFDPRRDAVLLIEQFRAAPLARRDPQPWGLEVVAGRCDAAEPPEATARREAREEAGLTLGRLELIAAYYPTPGIASEFITAFVGEASLDGVGGVHGLDCEDEDIRSIVVPLDEALAAAEEGAVNNAPLLLSLYWLARHHDRLAAAWARPLDGPEGSR
jgi:nudix-type nucleoside diphosphatase (YffH/AdpP family)